MRSKSGAQARDRHVARSATPPLRWKIIASEPRHERLVDDERAEDASGANERSLKLIIDTIPALAWSARSDGSADFFNQHYLDFIGFSPEQALDSGWTAAVHPEDLSSLLTTWRAILDARAPGETEARLRRHDGEYRWFLVRMNPLRDETGAIVKWYGVNTDIEDRKRAETELQRAYDEALIRAGAELAHVSRMTSLSALAASIAHEVNQPLSGIITNAGTCVRARRELSEPGPSARNGAAPAA